MKPSRPINLPVGMSLLLGSSIVLPWWTFAPLVIAILMHSWKIESLRCSRDIAVALIGSRGGPSPEPSSMPSASANDH